MKRSPKPNARYGVLGMPSATTLLSFIERLKVRSTDTPRDCHGLPFSNSSYPLLEIPPMFTYCCWGKPVDGATSRITHDALTYGYATDLLCAPKALLRSKRTAAVRNSRSRHASSSWPKPPTVTFST